MHASTRAALISSCPAPSFLLGPTERLPFHVPGAAHWGLAPHLSLTEMGGEMLRVVLVCQRLGKAEPLGLGVSSHWPDHVLVGIVGGS